MGGDTVFSDLRRFLLDQKKMKRRQNRLDLGRSGCYVAFYMRQPFLAVGVAAMVFFFLGSSGSECQAKEEGFPEKIPLSKAQHKVVDEMGWPYSFMIIDGQINEEGQKGRIETWSYPNKNKAYTFKDRELTGSDELKIARKNLVRTSLKPTMFTRKLDRGDVIEMLGKPADTEIKETEDGKIETLVYPDYNAAVILFKDRLYAVKSNLVEESKTEKQTKKESKE